MSKAYNPIVHADFGTDLNGLDGSLRKQAEKKIRSIVDGTFGYQGHPLHGDLKGFRSADFGGGTYKIIFSYCKECRTVGRNPEFIGKCPSCEQRDDSTIIFWRIDRHRGGQQDVYRVVSNGLSQMFPTKPT